MGTLLEAYNITQRTLYGYFLRAPGVRGKVKAQIDEATAKMEDKMVLRGPGITRYLALPKTGMTDEQIRTELVK